MRTARIAQNKQQGNQNKLNSIKNTLKFQFEDENEKNNDRTTSPSVTIKDLCLEDKAKIGDLIKRLAHEQEENKKLQDMIKQKEDDYKKQVKKYKQISDSAKKEQKQTEDKFKESLEVIKRLQQQEQLMHEQMLQARVNKFDSFTQYELDNKENNSIASQPPLPPPKPPKSEILQLKAEIEEFTNSLKQLQFESNSQERKEISPIRRVVKPEIRIERQQVAKQTTSQRLQTPVNAKPKQDSMKNMEVQTIDDDFKQKNNQNSADKQIQTEVDSVAMNSHTSNFFRRESMKQEQPITPPTQQGGSTIRFQDEFKALENKLKQNQGYYQVQNKEVSLQSESFQRDYQQPDDSSDDDQAIITQELLKRKNQRVIQQLSKRSNTSSQQSQYQQIIQYQVLPQMKPQSAKNSQNQFYQQQIQQQNMSTQQNLLQSNQFKTNTLSFNLTNQELTPQQSVQKSAEQFGSSVLQTPQQRELLSQQLQFSQQEDEIDSVITSLNGRSFNKPNILQQEQYPMIEQQQESYSSESSIPREEYQKLIDRYMKDNQESDDD